MLVLKKGLSLLLLIFLFTHCSPSIRSRASTLDSLIAASHNGWTQAVALGGRSPASQAIGLTTTAASVTLGWAAMSLPPSLAGSSISSYNIYRSMTSGAENFALPLATGLSANSLTYTDTTVSPSSTYYYVVRPVINGLAFPTTSTDTEIKMMVPPVNMSLVHRWIANWEMCSNLMGRTYDRDHHYRCSYAGPGNTAGYYDVGQNQFWDTVEAGCNYTPPNANASLSCNDSTNGCLNNGPPTASVADGQVYYNRQSAVCYVRSGGAWVATATASNAQLAQMVSNSPGLPPLVVLDQQKSWNACQSLSVGGLGLKRLPRHSEQIVAAAWSPTYLDSLISSIENGTNLPTTGYCNTNSGSGLTFDANPTPGDLETLPAEGASTPSYGLRTGSNATKNCISHHGIQDLVGNVWEFTSDQLTGCNSGAHTCTPAAVSSLDSTNTDWSTIPYDGLVGPGGVSIYTFSLADGSYNVTEFLAPLGLALVAGVSSSYDATVLGTTTGQINAAKLHGDFFYFYTDNGSTGSQALGGGDFSNADSAGRFAVYFYYPPADPYNRSNLGFRCMLSAGN
jgi:hypothetical protein